MVGYLIVGGVVIRVLQGLIVVLLLTVIVTASPAKEVVLKSGVFDKIKLYDVSDRSKNNLEWAGCGYGNYYSIRGFERVIVEDIVESEIIYTATSKNGQSIMTRGCNLTRNNKPFVADFHSHPRFNGGVALFPSDNDIIAYFNNPKTKVGCIVDPPSHLIVCYGRSTGFTGEDWRVGVGDSGWIVCDNAMKDCR